MMLLTQLGFVRVKLLVLLLPPHCTSRDQKVAQRKCEGTTIQLVRNLTSKNSRGGSACRHSYF